MDEPLTPLVCDPQVEATTLRMVELRLHALRHLPVSGGSVQVCVATNDGVRLFTSSTQVVCGVAVLEAWTRFATSADSLYVQVKLVSMGVGRRGRGLQVPVSRILGRLQLRVEEDGEAAVAGGQEELGRGESMALHEDGYMYEMRQLHEFYHSPDRHTSNTTHARGGAGGGGLSSLCALVQSRRNSIASNAASANGGGGRGPIAPTHSRRNSTASNATFASEGAGGRGPGSLTHSRRNSTASNAAPASEGAGGGGPGSPTHSRRNSTASNIRSAGALPVVSSAVVNPGVLAAESVRKQFSDAGGDLEAWRYAVSKRRIDIDAGLGGSGGPLYATAAAAVAGEEELLFDEPPSAGGGDSPDEGVSGSSDGDGDISGFYTPFQTFETVPEDGVPGGGLPGRASVGLPGRSSGGLPRRASGGLPGRASVGPPPSARRLQRQRRLRRDVSPALLETASCDLAGRRLISPASSAQGSPMGTTGLGPGLSQAASASPSTPATAAVPGSSRAGSRTGRSKQRGEAARGVLSLSWRVVREAPEPEGYTPQSPVPERVEGADGLAGTACGPGRAAEHEVAVETLPRELHSYAHGGFMGCAISMAAEPRWRNVLQQEQPSVHEAVINLLRIAAVLPRWKRSRPLLGLMMLLENSPVLCAYGLMRSGELRPAPPDKLAGAAQRWARQQERLRAAEEDAVSRRPVTLVPAQGLSTMSYDHSHAANIGGFRASIGGSRASVGGSRASVGGSRASVGGSRGTSVGGSRASVGGSGGPSVGGSGGGGVGGWGPVAGIGRASDGVGGFGSWASAGGWGPGAGSGHASDDVGAGGWGPGVSGLGGVREHAASMTWDDEVAARLAGVREQAASMTWDDEAAARLARATASISDRADAMVDTTYERTPTRIREAAKEAAREAARRIRQSITGSRGAGVDVAGQLIPACIDGITVYEPVPLISQMEVGGDQEEREEDTEQLGRDDAAPLSLLTGHSSRLSSGRVGAVQPQAGKEQQETNAECVPRQGYEEESLLSSAWGEAQPVTILAPAPTKARAAAPAAAANHAAAAAPAATTADEAATAAAAAAAAACAFEAATTADEAAAAAAAAAATAAAAPVATSADEAATNAAAAAAAATAFEAATTADKAATAAAAAPAAATVDEAAIAAAAAAAAASAYAAAANEAAAAAATAAGASSELERQAAEAAEAQMAAALEEEDAGPGEATVFGYAPLPLEWDLWVHPGRPWSVPDATVDHGSARALVTQTVTTAAKCGCLAATAGRRHIKQEGMSPVMWLNSFGRSVNRAAHGNPDVPLPWRLPAGAEEPWWYRLTARVQEGRAAVLMRSRGKDVRYYVRCWVSGNRWPLPRRSTGLAAPKHGRVAWKRDCAFWPLQHDLAPLVLHMEFRSLELAPPSLNTAPNLRNPLTCTYWRGAALVPLQQLLAGSGGSIDVQVPMHFEGEEAAIGEDEDGAHNEQDDDIDDTSSSGTAAPAAAPPAAAAAEKPASGVPIEGTAANGLSDVAEQQQQQTKQQHQAKQQQQRQEGPGPESKITEVASASAWLCISTQRPKNKAALKDVMQGVATSPLNAASAVARGAVRGTMAAIDRTADSAERLARGMASFATGGQGSASAAPRGEERQRRLRQVPMVRVSLSLEKVPVTAAARGMGVEPAAARSCAALLSSPGGLYLDVKSAYSSATDILLCCGALAGIGINVKAVCSFQPKQLRVSGLVPTVQFFHGLNGLEAAAEAGALERGSVVLFNGASFLHQRHHVSTSAADEQQASARPSSRTMQAKRQPLWALGEQLAHGHSMSLWEADQVDDSGPVGCIDLHAWRRYLALMETYEFRGGIYIQEPDCSPSNASVLTQLVSRNAMAFPSGFAYGHLRGKAVALLNAMGRGFATQQILEELGARQDLSRVTKDRILAQEHRGKSAATIMSWSHRLLYGSALISPREQQLLLQLLRDAREQDLVPIIIGLGGVPAIFSRFFEQYEMGSILTSFLVETTRSFNHTHELLLLLRDRRVLAGAPLGTKKALASFWLSPRLYGVGIKFLLHSYGLRRRPHEFASEGLVCLLESCTKEEADEVVRDWLGWDLLLMVIRGRVGRGKKYVERLQALRAMHADEPGTRMIDYQERLQEEQKQEQDEQRKLN